MLTKHNLIIGYTSLLWCSQPVGLSLSGDEWLFHKGCISDIHLEIQQQWQSHSNKGAWETTLYLGGVTLWRSLLKLQTASEEDWEPLFQDHIGETLKWRNPFQTQHPLHSSVQSIHMEPIRYDMGRGQVGRIPPNVRAFGWLCLNQTHHLWGS